MLTAVGASLVLLCQLGGAVAAVIKDRGRLAAAIVGVALLADAWVLVATDALSAPPSTAAGVTLAVSVALGLAGWNAQAGSGSTWERRNGDTLLAHLLNLAFHSLVAAAVAAVGTAYVIYGNWGGAVIMFGFTIVIMRQLVFGSR